MNAFHFYDALTAGPSSAEGQLLRFDSVMLSDTQNPLSTLIRLRDDVFIEPAGIEYTALFDHPLDQGVSEYEFSRLAEQIFLKTNTLHVGLGSTSGHDGYIRNTLYRNLSSYPNTSLPRHARFLDLATITRAIHYLRPEQLGLDLGGAIKSDSQLRSLLMQMPAFEDENSAVRVMNIFRHLYTQSEKLVSFAVKYSSPDINKRALGLDDGLLSDLGSVRPSVISHSSIPNERHFGVFMPIAVDMSYPDIIYFADLECDLTELCDPDTPSLDQLVRRRPDQATAPIVRVNLSRLPFIAPLGTIRPEDARRLSLDLTKVHENIQLLTGANQMAMRLLDEPIIGDTRMPADVDYRLLAGEYQDADCTLLKRLHSVDFAEWPKLLPLAHDNRILELGRRILLRYRQNLIAEPERVLWREKIQKRYCGVKVTPDRVDSILKLAEYSVKSAPGMKGPISHETRLRHLLGKP